MDLVMIKIFSYISIEERFRLQCVCWYWRNLIDSNLMNLGFIDFNQFAGIINGWTNKVGRIGFENFDINRKSSNFLQSAVVKGKSIEGLSILLNGQFSWRPFEALIVTIATSQHASSTFRTLILHDECRSYYHVTGSNILLTDWYWKRMLGLLNENAIFLESLEMMSNYHSDTINCADLSNLRQLTQLRANDVCPIHFGASRMQIIDVQFPRYHRRQCDVDWPLYFVQSLTQCQNSLRRLTLVGSLYLPEFPSVLVFPNLESLKLQDFKPFDIDFVEEGSQKMLFDLSQCNLLQLLEISGIRWFLTSPLVGFVLDNDVGNLRDFITGGYFDSDIPTYCLEVLKRSKLQKLVFVNEEVDTGYESLVGLLKFLIEYQTCSLKNLEFYFVIDYDSDDVCFDVFKELICSLLRKSVNLDSFKLLQQFRPLVFDVIDIILSAGANLTKMVLLSVEKQCPESYLLVERLDQKNCCRRTIPLKVLYYPMRDHNYQFETSEKLLKRFHIHSNDVFHE